MIKNKKQMFTIIGSFLLIMLLTTVTYAFFNYTRTGVANRISVGRIYFNSEQGNAINLTNVFPIDKSEASVENDNVDSVTIHITGDTTYSQGIEYLVSALDVNNTIGTGYNAKTIPISVDVSYEETENKTIGTEDSDYFENRGGNTSNYKVLSKRPIASNSNLVVGYIAPNQTGIDGTITIKAYIDKNRIAISDTYDSSNFEISINKNITNDAIANCANFIEEIGWDEYLIDDETLENYCNGTGTISGYSLQDHIDNDWFSYYPDYESSLIGFGILNKTFLGTNPNWVNGRTVLTTTEWNSFQQNGVSFKIKVEANEGIWVSEQGNAMVNIYYSDLYEYRSKIKEIYFNNMNSITMHQRYDAATIRYDLTYNNEGEVLAWIEENEDDNTMYNLYIASDGITYLTSGYSLFYDYMSVEKIEFNNVDTSRVTSMYNMFYNCYKLKAIDISSFNTENVTEMQYLFSNNYAIEEINMSGLDMRKVQSMLYMFNGCYNLEELDFTGSYTRDLTNIYGMFEGGNKLEYLDLSNFGGDNIIDSSSSGFSHMTHLKTLIMRNFNFGHIDYFIDLLSGYSNLEVLDLTGANFSNIGNVPMFSNSPNLTTIYVSEGVDFSSFTGNNANQMFSGCTSLVGGNGTAYDASNIDSSYAHVDGGQSNPGYFTASSN